MITKTQAEAMPVGTKLVSCFARKSGYFVLLKTVARCTVLTDGSWFLPVKEYTLASWLPSFAPVKYITEANKYEWELDN